LKTTNRVWKNGDKRIRSGFLWLPRSILVHVGEFTLRETRWLVHAKWEEEFSWYVGDACWTTTRFIDHEGA